MADRDYLYTGWYYDINNPTGFYGNRSGSVNDPYPGLVTAIATKPAIVTKPLVLPPRQNTQSDENLSVWWIHHAVWFVGLMILITIWASNDGLTPVGSFFAGFIGAAMVAWMPTCTTYALHQYVFKGLMNLHAARMDRSKSIVV